MENKVAVKYITKNIKTDFIEVFLEIINQTKANPNSIRNFRPTATRLCSVWLSGSLVCPLKKMTRVIMVIVEKAAKRIAISLKNRLSFVTEPRKYTIPDNNKFKNKSNKIYL